MVEMTRLTQSGHGGTTNWITSSAGPMAEIWRRSFWRPGSAMPLRQHGAVFEAAKIGRHQPGDGEIGIEVVTGGLRHRSLLYSGEPARIIAVPTSK